MRPVEPIPPAPPHDARPPAAAFHGPLAPPPSPPVPPPVRIHIGRLEVRAAPTAAVGAAARPPRGPAPPMLSLAEYLRARGRGENGTGGGS